MRYLLACLLVCVVINGWATGLNFDKPITVTAAQQGVFHHLESSGRRSLAVNNGVVAIVWEDNSSGQARIYVAFKSPDSQSFTQPRLVSESGPAYEPVIAAFGRHFVVGWESLDRIWLRRVSPAKFTAIQPLGEGSSRHLTLFAYPDAQQVLAVWCEKAEKYYQLHYAGIHDKNNNMLIQRHGLLDHSPDKTQQQYPSVAVTQTGMVVAWEDRRQGATRIMTAFAPTGKIFGKPSILNDFRWSRIQRFGRGTGAMRVILSARSDGQVIATWLDKRDFEGGYDVYAAVSENGGRSFAQDELVQDPLGENTPQWHPTVAVSDNGSIIVAWDDTRDGTPDIWYSLKQKQGWSDDEVWPGGNGEGAQTTPVLLFDQNVLHIAWLERQGKASSIRYLRAQLNK